MIEIDEERRRAFLSQVHDLSNGFSDALSVQDWPLRQWEVCGLLLERDEITHWALAKRGNRVATGKVRVEFTELVATKIRLDDVQRLVRAPIKRSIVKSTAGYSGGLTPTAWQELKRALAQIDAGSLGALERLEHLRDQSREHFDAPGVEVVAQQRDAVGVALDVFDEGGELRKRTLRGWTAPTGKRMTSFLDGLAGVRTIEDQLIARDATEFPGAASKETTLIGTVFSVAGRTLEVMNVNRTEIEHALGVDLLYFHEEFDAWTMVQYKCMERSGREIAREAVYRPDAAFHKELSRMVAFRSEHPDRWSPSDGLQAYRLCGDGFFFKLCSRVQLEVLSEALLPGMYLPREYAQAVIADDTSLGPHGGRAVTFGNARRHLSNSLFSDLVRNGWVGTRRVDSHRIASIVQHSLEADRSVVVARARTTRTQ